MKLKWACRLAMAVLCLPAVGEPARAVYYEDVPDVPITEDGVLLRYAGAEILLTRGTVQYPDRDVTITYAGNIYGDGGVAVVERDSIQAAPIALGAPIGPSLSWITINSRLVTTTCPKPAGPECTSEGTWAGGTHYLGLRFHDESGTYYGWARLGHAGGSTPVILYEFAIETTPDRVLLAGSIATLPYEIGRAMRFAAGIEAPAPGDVLRLDRAGEPGRIDLEDAVALVRLLPPPTRL